MATPRFTIGFQSGSGVLGRLGSRAVSAALRNVAEKWAKVLRKNAPYDRRKNPGPETRKTGKHLKDSIYVRTRGTSVEVVSDRKYLAYVLEGTDPHRIPADGSIVSFYWPKGKAIGTKGRKKNVLWRKNRQGRKVLRFPTGVFTFDHVNHKGAKANDFVKRQLPLLRKLLSEELLRISK